MPARFVSRWWLADKDLSRRLGSESSVVVIPDAEAITGWLPRIVAVLKRPSEDRYLAIEALWRFLRQYPPDVDICNDVSLNHLPELCALLFSPTVKRNYVGVILQLMGFCFKCTFLHGVEYPMIRSAIARKRVDVRRLNTLLLDRLQGEIVREAPIAEVALSTQAKISETTCDEIWLAVALAYLFPDIVFSNPRSVQFFVACLRSSSLHVRAHGMRVLFDFCRRRDPESQVFASRHIVKAWTNGFPPNLQSDLEAYGPSRCHGPIIMSATAELSEFLAQQDESLDFFEFGKTFAKAMLGADRLALSAPFAWKSSELPYNTWFETLPYAAQILRSRSELDLGDILELKFLLRIGQFERVKEIAEKAAIRSPQIGFWYYALTFAMDTIDPEVLELASKGLECPDLPAYERYALLTESSTRGWERALQLLVLPPRSSQFTEGIEHLNSSYRHFLILIDTAPPDSTGLIGLINLIVLVEVLRHGPSLSPDLKELNYIMKKIPLIQKINDFIAVQEGGLPGQGFPSGTVKDMIFKYFPTTAFEWKHFLVRADTCQWAEEEQASQNGEASSDILSEDIENLRLDGSQSINQNRKLLIRSLVGAHKDFHFYRCSSCGKPNASLRKCSICGQTSYCDKDCQKAHWKVHKKDCRSPIIAA
ncbi:hypothetical protein SISSUDRAFT_1060783 [Sistotremastrum suecicum HHB10207 ss-3]|uniref:MYND-type domain-containing protein n=1 Tax=Sistotremastrum suecicum HHB10207 ss-3 TaxID=1314776 RepID=A0A166ERG6_9AGAM|nr:hypothetical protein SISSUDRAFT_1060783 [Sistotremastrum suecicum HHB10207 ss-3]